MVMQDVVDNYESLLNFMAETAEALGLVHDWLNQEIKPDNRVDIYSFLLGHSSHLAVLNLAMNRLSSLETEHRQVITTYYEEK